MNEPPATPGGEQPAANSYGTDDPEVQADIEQARVDAHQQRQHDRVRLEHLVEAGLDPDDAEAVIEFGHFLREQRASEPAATASVESEASRAVQHEDAQDDLTQLVNLSSQPGNAAALRPFAETLTNEFGQQLEYQRYDVEAVARYEATGLQPDHARALAGYEHHLRRKLEQPLHHPRIYVADIASHRRGIRHGLWLDADQTADELNTDIAAMLESSPIPGAHKWAIQHTEAFGGLELGDLTDTALIARLARGLIQHGEAAYGAYVKTVGTDDPALLDRFEDLYISSYPSPEAWARHVANDLDWPRLLDEAIQDIILRRYVVIDYAALARDGALTWDVVPGSDGRTYVFMR